MRNHQWVKGSGVTGLFGLGSVLVMPCGECSGGSTGLGIQQEGLSSRPSETRWWLGPEGGW